MTKGRFPRFLRDTGAAFLIACCASLLAGGALAVEMEDLYTVQVALDPADPDAQNSAYARALEDVLIRVTGSEAVAESEDLRALFPQPARYVLQYRRGENDSLVVSLDGPAIEALLRRAAQPVWGNDRPLTLVWIAVDWGMGEREIIAADDPDAIPGGGRSIDRNRLLRESVTAAAARRGIPVLFPLLDAEDLENVSFSDVWGGFDEALIDASRRYGANSILVGRVRSGEMFRNRWSYYFGGQKIDWTGSADTAVNLLADSLAEQFAFAGDAPVETITLTISGVDSVSAYGTVERFLADLSVIDSYQLDSVAGGEIRFEVRVQGGSDRLASALEFSGILERQDWLDAQDYFGAPDSSSTLDYAFRPYRSEPLDRQERSPDDSDTLPPAAFETN